MSKSLHALIVTALEVEHLAVLAHLGETREISTEEGMLIDQGRFPGIGGRWTVSVVQVGPGNPQAASETVRAVTATKPSHVLFVGVAGGLKDVTLGDVVAAESVYYYESGKESSEGFLPRPRVGLSSYAMLHHARAVARRAEWQSRLRLHNGHMLNEAPRAFVKPIVAGESVLASTDSETYKLIRRNYSDALAVEMEGYGFLNALHANQGVERLIVRGVSDAVAGKSAADEQGWQEISSAAAAAFAYEILNRIAEFSSPGQEGAASGSSSDTSWSDLQNLLEQLYPNGPEDEHLWSRSGGDIAMLNLRQSGRTAWHSALRLLRNGGGGREITALSLLRQVQADFPQNRDIQDLLGRFNS